jgi:hypothetical protein
MSDTTSRQDVAMAAEFIDAEASSLPVHVASCQRRFETLNDRLKRLEMAAWSILAILIGGGGLTLRELIPIARALAGVP